MRGGEPAAEVAEGSWKLLRPILLVAIVGFAQWLPPSASSADELSLERFESEVLALHPTAPVSHDPLSMRATAVSVNPGPGDAVVAVMKLRLLPGWYIYAKVPAEQPFIETELILEHGPELSIIDDWTAPPTLPHKTAADTRIYESGAEDLLFFRELVVSEPGGGESSITVGLRYQICDADYCLPPRTKTQQLVVSLLSEENSS